MLRHRNEFPVEGRFPGFDGATAWFNSEPLTRASLQGRVVLVSFGTYTCINWMRSLPYVRAWADKYARHGLVVVGVQTPEFDFEGDLGNVHRAIKEMNVGYPVVVDNNYAVWNAFDNHYWPALYAVDAAGSIRYHHFGEGAYEETEMVLQMLLTEAGVDVDDGLVQIVPTGAEAAADWNDLRSPETYLGHERAVGFEPDTAPADLGRNEWTLSGKWTIGVVPVALDEPGGSISFCFHARDVHLVMGPPTSHPPVRFHVRLDGEAPELAHGADIDEDGNGIADYQRLYQLVRQQHAISDRLFEIEFLDAGVEAFVFTFG
jgi:hypothetical protein